MQRIRAPTRSNPIIQKLPYSIGFLLPSNDLKVSVVSQLRDGLIIDSQSSNVFRSLLFGILFNALLAECGVPGEEVYALWVVLEGDVVHQLDEDVDLVFSHNQLLVRDKFTEI
jgi:hypothetical protein